MIIIMAVSFYTVRVVLDTLGITDFGLYELVASFVAIMVFLNGTLTSGTQRFLTFEIGKNDLKKLKQTFSTALLIHIALAFLILLFDFNWNACIALRYMVFRLLNSIEPTGLILSFL